MCKRTARQRGHALILSVDGRPAAAIAVADPVNATTSAALERLWADGIRIVMLTDDNRTTAQAVAHEFGIQEVEADVFE
jgi:P-type E1-E2 ATPase